MRQVFFDTETTGLSAEGGDRLVEIGCIEMVGRRLTGNNRHFYLNPERKSSEEAVRVHGLTDAFLADKPRFSEVVDELLAFLAGAELIIHNAGFDIGFMNAELKRIGREPVGRVVNKVTDTLLMAREMFPGKSNSLDALCRRLEVDNSGRTLHGALLDAQLLAEVFIRLTRGQNSFDMGHSGDVPTQKQALEDLEELDLSRFTLSVLEPSAEELQAHENVLAGIDKASGLALWRKLVA